MLLERDDELAAASALLADARREHGRALLIEGAPGLGKSALIHHVAEAAREGGFRVLSASGCELERGLGWGVARTLFELAADDALLDGPAASARVLFASEPDGRPASDVSFGIMHGLFWLAVRLAEPAPLLLVVDDAHWADEPSLRFLAYLAGRVRELPVALLVATRPRAGGLLDHLEGTVCEPAPLSDAAVAELIRARVPGADDELCRRCAELTAGNPLGARELAAAIAAEGDLDASVERAARSLSRSVLRRIAALAPEAGALAGAVAVFERGVPLHQAATLAGLHLAVAHAAADALAGAGVVNPGDPVTFVHPLMRAAVYGALPVGRRAETHRLAASLLAAASAPAEQVAGHLLEARPEGDQEVVATLREAARQAMAHGVPGSASAYLERALREPPADRAAVLAELGRADAPQAPRRAIEHFEAAIALTAEPARRAGLALELGRAMHDTGRPADACAAFAQGMEDAEGELAVELDAWYLTSAVLLPERADDAHRRMEALVARAGTSAGERALASKSLIMRVYAGQPSPPLVALARELWGSGRLIDEGGIASQAIGHVAGTLSYADEYATADEVLRRTQERTRRSGWVSSLALASQLLSRQQAWTGPVGEALANASTAFEIFAGGLQLYLPASGYCLARAQLECDDPEGAEQTLALVERSTVPEGMFAAWHHEARGRLAAHLGDFEGALAAFEACGERLSGVLISNPAMFPWRSEAGLAALRLGRRERARELIADELERAERFGAPRPLGVARRALAVLDRDAAGLRAAVELLAGCGAHVEHAHALVELGGLVRRAKRPGEARDVLREALRFAEAAGSAWAARLARDELTRAGGRAPVCAERGLTPSERRVAERAAAGRTNRQIADELYLTVKSVEWHLGNAYRKLDIRGRSGLVEALAD